MITKFSRVHQLNPAERYADVLEFKYHKFVRVNSYDGFYLQNSSFLEMDENKWVEMYCIIHDISWRDITITSDMISVEPINENSAKILR